jgi:hypothetical protein
MTPPPCPMLEHIEASTCYKAIVEARARQRGEAENNLPRAVTLHAGITAAMSVRCYHSPQRAGRKRAMKEKCLAARRLVHDKGAELEEGGCALHRFGEEVRVVVRCGDERDAQLERLDHIANEEVAALDVLHARVVLRVIRRVLRALVVGGEVPVQR